MRRTTWAVFAWLVSSLFWTDAYAQQAVYGGSLTIAQGVEPPGLDPTTATSAVIPRVVYSNVLEGLLKIDRTGKIYLGE